MKINYKDLHIGSVIKRRVEDLGMQTSDIYVKLNCSQARIEEIFQQKSVEVQLLLTFSKLLDFDFFRIYSQHLILYSQHHKDPVKTRINSPEFTRNLYTKEIIDFVLELLNKGIKSRLEIQQDYNIPRSTLQKWISKYN